MGRGQVRVDDVSRAAADNSQPRERDRVGVREGCGDRGDTYDLLSLAGELQLRTANCISSSRRNRGIGFEDKDKLMNCLLASVLGVSFKWDGNCRRFYLVPLKVADRGGIPGLCLLSKQHQKQKVWQNIFQFIYSF